MVYSSPTVHYHYHTPFLLPKGLHEAEVDENQAHDPYNHQANNLALGIAIPQWPPLEKPRVLENEWKPYTSPKIEVIQSVAPWRGNESGKIRDHRARPFLSLTLFIA